MGTWDCYVLKIFLFLFLFIFIFFLLQNETQYECEKPRKHVRSNMLFSTNDYISRQPDEEYSVIHVEEGNIHGLVPREQSSHVALIKKSNYCTSCWSRYYR